MNQVEYRIEVNGVSDVYKLCGEIKDILSLILPSAFELFECGKIATKAVNEAGERINALTHLGFAPTDENLIGDDGRKYDSYYILRKINI